MSLPTPDIVTDQQVRQLLQRLARLKKNWPQEPALRDLSPQMVEALQEHINTQNTARLMAFIIIATMMTTLHLLHSAFSRPLLWFDVPLIAMCVLATGYRPGKAHRYAVYALTQAHDAGSVWRFLRLRDTTVYVDRTEYYLKEVEKIVGILLAMLGEASTASSNAL